MFHVHSLSAEYRTCVDCLYALASAASSVLRASIKVIEHRQPIGDVLTGHKRHAKLLRRWVHAGVFNAEFTYILRSFVFTAELDRPPEMVDYRLFWSKRVGTCIFRAMVRAPICPL
jgi:hypothetical protein